MLSRDMAISTSTSRTSVLQIHQQATTGFMQTRPHPTKPDETVDPLPDLTPPEPDETVDPLPDIIPPEPDQTVDPLSDLIPPEPDKTVDPLPDIIPL